VSDKTIAGRIFRDSRLRGNDGDNSALTGQGGG